MTWENIEAGELMARRNGSVDPAKFPDEQFELHSIPAFDAGRPEVLCGRDIGSAKQIVRPADVMISKIVPHIRRASVVGRSSGLRQIASGEWIVFRSERIFPHYLRHLLVSDRFNSQFMATVSGVGGSLLRARPAEVAKIKIPLPPISEQRRIAAILDKADALRAKRREAIAKLDQLLQSVFLDMFGDPVANPKAWPAVKVGDVFSSFVGGKNVECPEESTSPYRILKVSSVTSKVYRPEESKCAPEHFLPAPAAIVEDGDLLFSRANTTQLVAATAYVWSTPENIVLPDKLWKMRVAEHVGADVLFLWALFKNVSFREEVSKRSSGTSGSMKNIAKSKLVKVPMPLPPLSLQERFADITRAVERQRRALLIQADRQDTFFASLQHRAFSATL